MDGSFVKNQFASRRNDNGTAIVHAEVSPAKLIAIEPPEEQTQPKENSGSVSEKSPDGNVTVNISADGSVSHLSPQSNDSGDVGNSETDDKPSDISQGGISQETGSIPSSHPEAEGGLTGRKGNDEPSAQQGEVSV